MIGEDETHFQWSGNIEELVNNAMGYSVTPSRLLNSHEVSFLRRLLGNKPVNGPFTADLADEEQPHYLLHSTNFLDIPEEDKVQNGRFSLFGKSVITPVVLIVTDRRSIFVYGYGDSRQTISIEHTDLIDVKYSDFKIEKDLQLRTTQRHVGFAMWVTDPHASEVTEAAAYIFQKSDLDGEYRSYDFDSENYSTARSGLIEQLGAVRGLSDKVDIEHVAICALKGARIGATKGPLGAGVGFMLGAGYGIWSSLYSETEAQDVVDDIDPNEIAEVMLRWQQYGKLQDNRGLELASGALGAAIAIDKESSGRKVSTVLADLDVEWVSRQLEAGNNKEAGLQVASDVLQVYSTELAELLEEDFFQRVSGDS